MATGSATDGKRMGERPSIRHVGQKLLSALVSTPGKSTAALLVGIPYVWLGYYVVGTLLGRQGDVIVSGDWLTLVFTTYALLSSLALAHRILQVGLDGLTVESLLDVVALVWLTVFYFVWMAFREPVSSTTSVAELYRPVMAGHPGAIFWVLTVVVVAILATGIILFPRSDSRPFKTRFRTALVTFPVIVTAAVLLLNPGVKSLVWPIVCGVFLGTLIGGAARIHVIATAIAKGIFAGLSLIVWAIGAMGWLLVHRERPPSEAVKLAQSVWGPGDDRTEAGNEES